MRKCSVPAKAGTPTPDPNNINGLITAYVIICIVLFVLFVMFIACGTFSPTTLYSRGGLPSPQNTNGPTSHLFFFRPRFWPCA